jgi:hypothetical protein
MEFPLKRGENWWWIHPNDGRWEMVVPLGAGAICTKKLKGIFSESKPYQVVEVDDIQGWISLQAGDDIYKMPRYLFVRHFDAEAFIRPYRSERYCSTIQEFDPESDS